MTPVVLIRTEGGVPVVVGGTKGLRVVFLDFDSFDPHPSYSSLIVEESMSDTEIINYITTEIQEHEFTKSNIIK